MQLTIDLSSDIPLYQQLQERIIALISRGELRAGDRLPSVRQLAVDTGINLHTVNKAYNQLKLDGYLTIGPRGARVSARLEPDAELLARVSARLDSAAREARSRGLARGQFLLLCEQAFDLAGQTTPEQEVSLCSSL